MYTIGRLARRAGVNADSIRFYERQGLLTPADRTDTGYRLYTDDAVRRIAFIKHAQHCGFSLAEIGRFLRMHKADGLSRSDAYRLAARKQKEIGDTIESLQAMAAALTCVLASRGSPADWPWRHRWPRGESHSSLTGAVRLTWPHVLVQRRRVRLQRDAVSTRVTRRAHQLFARLRNVKHSETPERAPCSNMFMMIRRKERWSARSYAYRPNLH